uniref:Cysteine-rich DPF motif domain-containing protein 1 n=1 Tax=Molossus molossus TaxID=27622 RepID=A0A7J8BK85_MOLMO|nr:cysteine rich DPF motif domain containing 1 [Molossus molossus]
MAREAEHRPVGVFECQLCALAAPYSYVGQKPPDTQSVILLEESYVMKDPFTPDKAGFLILGSRCSVCSRLVCVGPVGEPRVTGAFPSSAWDPTPLAGRGGGVSATSLAVGILTVTRGPGGS